MKKLLLKSFIVIGTLSSALYGIDNKEDLLDHGFIEKDREDQSENIYSQSN